jgi:pSer/pThr/pTyr-binding forkhead associated (FHA) protein
MPSSDSANVLVAVRVRPFNEREAGTKCIVKMNGEVTTLIDPDTGKETQFTFDHSYWSHDKKDANFADNKKVFDDIGKGVLKNAWLGYNASLFAYGQTGSGKSYSMVGYGEDKGIIPMVCDQIFQEIESKPVEPGVVFQVECTMIEIYNEKVRDLLNPKNNPPNGLTVRENPKTGPYVEGLVPVVAKNYDDISRLMDQGSKARTVGETKMNKTSSRAHTLFTLIFTQGVVNPATKKVSQKVSKITLVDLAGSERMDSTGATGDRAKEGANINLSLSELGNCISALALKCSGTNPNQFIPYRNSSLTFIMKESLGGNSRTAMIAAVSPASINYQETLSTLNYAKRAKQITNKAKVNEDPQERLIKSLQEEVARLNNLLKDGGISNIVKDDEAEKRAVELQEEIERSRALITELQMSNEEKEKRSKEIEQERLETLRGAGLVSDSSFNRKTDCHLINLNEDPQINENLIYALNKPRVVIGHEKDGHQVDISLSSLGVSHEHCAITVTGDQVKVLTVSPITQTKDTYVNGQKLTGELELHNGDRLAVGSNQIFRVVNPLENNQVQNLDWELAVREMADNLAKEKTQEALNNFKQDYKIHEEMLSILPDVNEANEMADRVKKNVEYQIKVQENENGTKRVVIHAREEDGLWSATWEKEAFLDRFSRMHDRYKLEKNAMKNDEAADLPSDGDPFIDEEAAGKVTKKKLKKVDVSVYEDQIAELTKRVEDITMEYRTAEQEAAWLREQIDKNNVSIAQRDINILGKNRKLEEVKHTLERKEEELKQREDTLHKLQQIRNQELTSTEGKDAQLARELAEATNTIEAQHDTISRLESEIDKLKSENGELKVVVNSPRDDHKKELEQVRAEVKVANTQAAASKKEAEDTKRELQKAKEQIANYQKEIEANKRDLATARNQIQLLEQQGKSCCTIS